LETKLTKLIKPIEAKAKLRFGSLEELGDSLLEYIESLVNVFSKSNEELEKILDHFYEENLRCCALQALTFQLITEKLKAVYGVDIEIDQLQKEARDTLNNNWPEIKKNALDYVDLSSKINDIFKKE